jgi:hypothetical protein
MGRDDAGCPAQPDDASPCDRHDGIPRRAHFNGPDHLDKRSRPPVLDASHRTGTLALSLRRLCCEQEGATE